MQTPFTSFEGFRVEKSSGILVFICQALHPSHRINPFTFFCPLTFCAHTMPVGRLGRVGSEAVDVMFFVFWLCGFFFLIGK